MGEMINVRGRLVSLSEPLVMGILNVTPDSFYAGSRKQTEQEIVERVRQIATEGGAIIDVGACSTRPGFQEVSETEEMDRLRFGLGIVRRELPDSVVSVDTFRPDVARMAVEEFGADIVNDVSEGGTAMFRMVSNLRVPYILMSQQPTILEVGLVEFNADILVINAVGIDNLDYLVGKTFVDQVTVREVAGDGIAIACWRVPQVNDFQVVWCHAQRVAERHDSLECHRPDEGCLYPSSP